MIFSIKAGLGYNQHQHLMAGVSKEATHYRLVTLIALHYQGVSGLEAMEIKIWQEEIDPPSSGEALRRALKDLLKR